MICRRLNEDCRIHRSAKKRPRELFPQKSLQSVFSQIWLLSLWSDTEHPGSIHGNRINLAIKSKAIKFEMILMCQRNQKWMNTAAHLWVKEWKGSECVYTMPIRAYCSDAKSERPTLRGLTFELQQKREPGAYHEKQSEIPTTKSYKSFWKECSHLNTTGCNLKSKNGKKKKITWSHSDRSEVT